VSRIQKLILIGMALLDLIVLCALVVAVISSLRGLSRPAATAPTSTPTLVPAATRPPTWTPTLSSTPRPTGTPGPTRTATVAPTPWPTRARGTSAPVPTPTPEPTVTPRYNLLENSTFDDIEENSIPGWQMGAYVNWEPGTESDPASSFAAPRFHMVDNVEQRISGSTLQIDTVEWVKLKAWVFQTVTVKSGSRVTFQVRAAAIVQDEAGGYFLKVGIDPEGGLGCDAAEWGEEQHVNQTDGVLTLLSPEVIAGEPGYVTVCIFAETQYAQAWHAAFFDEADLTVISQGSDE
jgi:hypothetical protein